MEMLKSLLRMDEDQCARRVALKYFDVVDPGYYEFESTSQFSKLINMKLAKDFFKYNNFSSHFL